MRYFHRQHRRALGLISIIAFAIALHILLSQVRAVVPQEAANATQLTSEQKESIAANMARQQSLSYFEASLKMKEQVDFLLTPALLVQEALREDAVVTYPTE